MASSGSNRFAEKADNRILRGELSQQVPEQSLGITQPDFRIQYKAMCCNSVATLCLDPYLGLV